MATSGGGGGGRSGGKGSTSRVPKYTSDAPF